jgi:hypothetical protein
MSIYQAPTRTIGKRLATTSAVLIYAAPTTARGTQLVSLHVANVTGGAVNVTVELFSAADSQTYRWASATPVAGNAGYDVDFNGAALAGGDEIRVTASAADALDALLTIREPQPRSQG